LIEAFFFFACRRIERDVCGKHGVLTVHRGLKEAFLFCFFAYLSIERDVSGELGVLIVYRGLDRGIFFIFL
jgi:hypothetical protein